MKRLVLFLLLSLTFMGVATAEQLDRYPSGRVPLPEKTMVCPDITSVAAEMEAIEGNPENGIMVTTCEITGEDYTASMYFNTTAVSSQYVYDVLELKLWKRRPDGRSDIYLGTYYTVGSYAERPRDMQTGEVQLTHRN